MKSKRNYNSKAVDMLMTAKTIVVSFLVFLKELAVLRTNWTESYAKELETKIDAAINTQLGIDAKKGLREASAKVSSIQKPARRDLALFKTQIDDDFKKNLPQKDEILKTLGFSKNLRNVQKNENQPLVELLYAFKTNMTAELRLAITSKGMNPVLIDNIIGYADLFKNANITQESSKGSTKVITNEVVDSFNEIYDEVIGICKKASRFYKNEPLKKEQFTFNKVLANVRTTHRTAAKIETKETNKQTLGVAEIK